MNRAMLTALVLLTACDKTNDLIEAYQENDTLVVDIQKVPAVYTETCMVPLIQLAQITDEGSIPLYTDIEEVTDLYAGYWMDGSFVYPVFNEGCDVVMCIPLEDNIRSGLTAYTVVGEDVQRGHRQR